jgi:GSCFA family
LRGENYTFCPKSSLFISENKIFNTIITAIMEFRTVLKPHKAPFDIDYQDSIVGIGSCFVDNIGVRLTELQFTTLLNPFGIIYNPISIFENIEMLLSDNPVSETDLHQHNGLWHSWQHHSKFSQPDKEDTLLYMNESLTKARSFLKKSNKLIITLGTAHVYIEKKSEKIVANCHKVPPQYFDKKMLTVAEIVDSFENIINKMYVQNIESEIIVTISPVRHIRDGIIENQKSKSILFIAVDEICKKFKNVHYFPAYELMMDDLRDYRFYEPDMIHPNSQAIDYIWQFFMDTYFTKSTYSIAEEVKKINLMMQHRPLHPNTEGYQQFLKTLNEKIKTVEKKYPFLNFK